MVRLKIIVVALLVVALATFAVDCGATMTAEQAALCCKNMNCQSQGQDSQDCCKIKPSLHLPFVQTPVHEVSFPSVAVATVSVTTGGFPQTSTLLVVLTPGHAPPILAPPAQVPIRI
jgi:hypothetical protein